MGRLIDADMVEDMLRECTNNALKRRDERASGLNLAILQLRNIPTIIEEVSGNKANGGGWISVSSGKLPEAEGDYLVTRANGKVNTGKFVLFTKDNQNIPYDKNDLCI